MYGLTARFDASMFVGLRIESVTFAENAIHVSLGKGFAITSTTWIRYRANASGEPHRDELPVSESSLPALIGVSVSGGERTAHGGLVLSLESGGEIAVDDDSDRYECFSITTPDGEIFV